MRRDIRCDFRYPTVSQEYRGLANGFRVRRLLAEDFDNDGVFSFYDCDDTNKGSYIGYIDCDGISSENDCDNYNASVTLQKSQNVDCDPSTED